MGMVCEWHTEDYFEVDSGPHIAIGMRGPVKHDPHRGRGLAIGILANRAVDPADPDNPVPLFRGCMDPPGGPSFFIEDFTVCDGMTPVREWQLSTGQDLPDLQGNGLMFTCHATVSGPGSGRLQSTRPMMASRPVFTVSWERLPARIPHSRLLKTSLERATRMPVTAGRAMPSSAPVFPIRKPVHGSITSLYHTGKTNYNLMINMTIIGSV